MAPHGVLSVVGPVRWGRDATRGVVLSVIGIAAVLIVAVLGGARASDG